jgi:pyrroline-5-carboxylate reductase
MFLRFVFVEKNQTRTKPLNNDCYCKARGIFSIVQLMKISASRVGFVGFGHMAQILFRSIDLAKLIPRSQILFTRRDQGKMRKNQEEFGITSASLETLVERSDLIFLCIRPQQADQVLEHLAKIGVSDKRVISILAGLKIAYFEKRLPGAAVIRAMPNLPAE